VRAVNEAAAAPPLVPRLAADGAHAGWAAPTAAAALSTIARDAVDLLGDPRQRARLRECASDDCPLVFYDDSRPGRRRWCSDERCGDRARARAYRDRRRAGRSAR
jgi:predicted RNA-binding Zn ribbon-like protein